MLQGKCSSQCQKTYLLSTYNLQDSCSSWVLVIHGKGTRLLEGAGILKAMQFSHVLSRGVKRDEISPTGEITGSVRGESSARHILPLPKRLPGSGGVGRALQKMNFFPSGYAQEEGCKSQASKSATSVTSLSPLSPRQIPSGRRRSWLLLLASVNTLWMYLLCIPLKQGGKQRALMNSFVYDDNTFLSPSIDLPSKLIKRANLAVFTALSPSVMSESTEPVCFSKFK